MMHPMNAAEELKLYIDNDGALYRSQTTSILKNLVTKRARGEYRHDLAVKAFGYLTEAGAKKYAKEHGSPDLPWNKMFDVTTRKQAAEALTRAFEGEASLGNYDHLLPKKYQKQEKTTGHSTKKTSSSKRKKATSSRSSRLEAIEARRRALTAARESISSTSSGISARDIWEFGGFLRNATDRQVQGSYEKEKRAGRDEYAEMTRVEAERRGIPLDEGHYDHARKKSPAQLKHDIAAVLGTRRYS
jgi:hypothetical protein